LAGLQIQKSLPDTDTNTYSQTVTLAKIGSMTDCESTQDYAVPVTSRL